ncbi:MAG: ABC transporter ATP-binding protein, partial [Acidimicrobiales bacterium]
LTARHLVVIGRGSLIAETTVDEFIAQSAGEVVRVVTPMQKSLVTAVEDAGAKALVDDGGALIVSGLTSSEVGELAARRSLTLHELTPVRASLEDAFMELTRDAVEYSTALRPQVMATSGAPFSKVLEDQ